jgi:DNA-binding NtrC family response regulator
MATLRAVSARKLHSLFQRSREPIFVLDSSLRLVFANRAWEELTGRTSEAASGLVCRPGLAKPGDSPLGDLASSFCPPAECLQGRPSSAMSLIPNISGERQPRRLEFSPLLDGRGRLIGLFGLIRGLDSPTQAPESPSHRLRAELSEVRERLRAGFGQIQLVGSGPAHRRLIDQVTTAALTFCPLLVQGEPGSGKRLVARMIHQKGAHAHAPFVQVDVEALSSRDLERSILPDGQAIPNSGSEGYISGTSLAIGDVLALPRDVQARLAERLEAPPGAIRIIGLTGSDPDQARREDRLRDDLYYALTSMVIRLPPLRARLDELPLLAQEFLEQANAHRERRRWGFEPAAIEVLRSYDWPGNLAELARVVNAAHERASGDLIAEADLPAEIRGAQGAAYSPPSLPVEVTPLDQTLETVERRLIEQALSRSRRNKSRAAELLDISRPRLYRRIKELNIPDEGESSPDGPST